MAKRMILTLVLSAVFIGGLGLFKVRQFQAMAEQFAAMQPPPEAVTTIVAERAEWPATFEAIGTVSAVQGVMVSADLAGIVTRIAFTSGRRVAQGDILVELDTRQERAQLAAAEADLDLAQLTFERMQALVAQDAVSRAEFDNAAAAQKQAQARIEEIRATIDRKTIRAPFSGVLGIRAVNLGQYLTGGAPVVPLQSLDPIHVDLGIPQQYAGRLKRGQKVRVMPGEAVGAAYTGRITAVDSVVDDRTRNIRAQVTLPNPGSTLRPGMFVRADVLLGAADALVTVPATAINHAPYGDTFFVVSDLTDESGRPYLGVRQQVVKLGGTRGDRVGIVSGVAAGEQVVTSGVFKLRNGSAIQINNDVQPSNELAPSPEDG
jgi:membrane fusion protein, multidrug efflux system